MAGLIYDFVEILEIESEYYEKLAEIGNLKRSYIIKGGLKELTDVNTAEGHLTSKMRAVEKKRSELMYDIATVLNINKDSVTISQIEAALVNQPEEAEALAKAKKRISAALNKLKIINDENMILINQSLDYTEYTINMLQSSQSEPITADYAKGIKKQSSSVFDTKQ